MHVSGQLGGEVAVLGQQVGEMGDVGLLCPYPFEEFQTLVHRRMGAVFSPLTLLDAAQDGAQLLRIRLPEPARYQISVGRPANAEPWTPAQTFEDIIGALFGD